MMTVIQYEGSLPTGPLAEFWQLTPAAGGDSGQQIPNHGGDDGNGNHTTHSGHGPQEDQGSPVVSAATATSGEGGGADAVAEIAMEDDHFSPKTLTIKVGTTVTWINKGADWHSVAAFDGSFESAQVSPGESFSHTFDIPGTYKFLCRHHGRQGMIGQIVVTE
jgi:plastocyanin